jgi:dihydropteroate synthase
LEIAASAEGAPALHCGAYRLALDRPLIMGIVNVTPDSFSDGGQFLDPAKAVERGKQLIDEGADILDVGGESSRPGAAPVLLEAELQRVMPVVEALAGLNVPLSIDTVKPEVMRRGLEAGAAIINDISALEAPGALETVAASGAAVVLMHMRGTPATMQQAPNYADVVAEVRAYLMARIAAAQRAGIPRGRIVVDPGFGFGKLLDHNLALLRHLDRFAGLGCPLLVGLSRKSMLKGFSSREMDRRMPASVAAALIAVQRGAHIVRVHDVAATHDALAVWRALSAADQSF